MKKKMNLATLTLKSFRTSDIKGGLKQKGPMPANGGDHLFAFGTGVPSCYTN